MDRWNLQAIIAIWRKTLQILALMARENQPV